MAYVPLAGNIAQDILRFGDIGVVGNILGKIIGEVQIIKLLLGAEVKTHQQSQGKNEVTHKVLI